MSRIATSTTERLKTRGQNDCLDITERVQRAVREAKLGSGLATVFVTGSTAGVTTIEYEPGAVQDLQEALRRLAPETLRYHHHETAGDDNGFAHVRAALMGPSLTVPVVEGRLALGTWQQIILVDFDAHPRERTVLIHLLGESAGQA
jgi:secondary thiamine-phosphate synthase enzyme